MQTQPEQVTVTAGKPESQTETMKALVYHGKRDVRYETVARPIIVDAQDALIRVTATCICGSDLHIYNNELPDVKTGQVLGHEAMGFVEQVGPGVKHIQVGDRVVIAFSIACGTCDHCKRQQFSGCERTNPSKLMKGLYGHCTSGVFGYGGMLGGYSGGQAEYVRVPFADLGLLKIPDTVSDEKALSLSDVSCTSYHAVYDLGQVKKGDSVAIWGAGPIGILAAKWCELAGAKDIFVIDNVVDRIQLVKANVPGVVTINFDEVNTCETLEKLCPAGVDVAIEAAGFRYAKSKLHKVMRAVMLETDTPEILNEAIVALKLYGRLAIIGDYVGLTNGFNIGAMMEKHLFVSGGQCPVQAVWHTVLARIQDGSFDPTICITTPGKLSDGPDLYSQFNLKQIVKTFLRP